jgi:hypothetical protein
LVSARQAVKKEVKRSIPSNPAEYPLPRPDLGEQALSWTGMHWIIPLSVFLYGMRIPS